jgi:hypothetical protein
MCSSAYGSREQSTIFWHSKALLCKRRATMHGWGAACWRRNIL